MAGKSRTYNSSLNLVTSAGKQVITLILGFVSRWLFIKVLGASYLGINGLFANIISVLSMADLGFGSAIVYSMYKPLAENDERKMAALLQFYKKVYRIIALIISVIGISLVPFLKYLVNLENPIEHLELYYVLFLTNVIISYLFSYRMCIITADQKDYLLNLYSFIFTIIQFVLQIIVLVTLKNYIIYLFTQIICSLANNIYASRKSVKMYPYIIRKEKLSKNEQREIGNNIKGMFLYKVGGVLLNNTDNILISTMISTILVGIYSNYSMIVTSVNTFASMIFNSVNASVGNLSVEKEVEYQYKIYKVIDFAAFFVYGLCSVCLFVLMGDFVEICYGAEYRLSKIVCLIIVLNFYLPGTLSANSIFRNATGMFKEMRFLLIVTSTINLILSILLGRKYGILGIFMATLLARLLTNVWYEPVVLYKKYFKKKASNYFLSHISRDLVIAGILFFTDKICEGICGINIGGFFIKVFICAAFPILFLCIAFGKSKEFQYIKHIVKSKLQKRG